MKTNIMNYDYMLNILNEAMQVAYSACVEGILSIYDLLEKEDAKKLSYYKCLENCIKGIKKDYPDFDKKLVNYIIQHYYMAKNNTEVFIKDIIKIFEIYTELNDIISFKIKRDIRNFIKNH